MRESTVEEHLVRRVEQLGGEVRKVKWIGRTKAPDRLVMLPKRPPPIRNPLMRDTTTVWVELKATGGKAKFPKNGHERGQLREHERMRAMHQTVVVIDSIEGVEELLA